MGSSNLNDMMESMKAANAFRKNHPKFEKFYKAVKKEGLREGTILSISVETPEGKKLETNLRIMEGDEEAIELLKKYHVL